MAGNKASTKRLTNTDTGLPLVRVAPVMVEASRAGGGNAVRFLFPPKGAIPLPGSGRVSRQAGGLT